jgi:hypothetical protein
MIKSTKIEELTYDVQSQIAVMQTIRKGLSTTGDCDLLKYFVREYCRTADIPASLVELKLKHGELADEIEAVECVPSVMPW